MARKDKLAAAFHEVKKNPPAILAKTRKKSGKEQARKQAVAIALSKARQHGAKIPKGGNTELSKDSMKAQMCSDRTDNLSAKNEFVTTRKRTTRESF